MTTAFGTAAAAIAKDPKLQLPGPFNGLINRPLLSYSFAPSSYTGSAPARSPSPSLSRCLIRAVSTPDTPADQKRSKVEIFKEQSNFIRYPPSSSFSTRNPILLAGLRVDNYENWGFNKKGRIKGNGAADRDSEFEVDPDKAREALKKLDEQLQSLSNKQTNPPKIRAVDMKQSIDPKERKKNKTESAMMEEKGVEISGSFLASVAGGLLLFTILYNIFFLTVIKPSIDGPNSFPDVMQETQGDSFQELSSITDVPLSP